MMDVDLSDDVNYGHAHVWTEALAPKNMGLQKVTIVQAIDMQRFLDGFVRAAQAVPKP